MDSPDLTTKSADVKTGNDKIVEFLDMLPLIGRPCAWVYKHWGLTGLVSFIFGLGFGLGLVFFGAVPKSFVAKSYKISQQPETPKPETPKVKLSSLEVTTIRDPKPDWLQPYVDMLDNAAEDKRTATTRAGMGAVTSSPLPRTEKFRWVLKAMSGFALDGRAFRVTKDGYVKLFDRVKDQNSIYFEIPECEEGDRIVGVIIATWEGSQPQIEIQDTFRSTVIPGER